jgi:prepilin-type N-terminal cleavage/methylation domain-containing protein
MSTRPGFTLLEVVLATALLGALTVAVLSWVATQTRANRAAARRLDGLTAADAIASAIRDDLLQALPDAQGRRYQHDGDGLRLTTLNRMPGDAGASRRIAWRQDAKLGALVREVKAVDPRDPPDIRVASRQVALAAFQRDKDSGVLMFSCRLQGQAHELRFPLAVPGMP